MQPQTLPLFGPATPKPERASLDGWRTGDDALLHNERNPGHWRKAQVIAVSPRSHILTLRCDDASFGIVQVQMPEFAHKLRRPSC